MTKEQFLLTCIAEECCELGQRATKAIRFGLDEVQRNQDQTNAQRFVGELTDLTALVEMLTEDGRFPQITREGLDAKKDKFNKYLLYSAELGQVDL